MNISAKKWNKNIPPKKVLVIRLQAMGDVVITLPYLLSLRKILPASTSIDMLTRHETYSLPASIQLFDRVYIIRGKRSFWKQLFYAIMLVPRLIFQRYDLVIDLQNNGISRLVTKALRPQAWSQFDRYSPISAGERNKATIQAAGFSDIEADFGLILKVDCESDRLLKENGWDAKSDLVVLNPAGAFVTRHWPLENYISFAKLWRSKFPGSQFLILGLESINEKAIKIKNELQKDLINLAGKTNSSEAFSIIKKARFVLSEDSGLMHIAWVGGTPTFVLFGSTRSDWARPIGDHTGFLDSSDLSCGNCMSELCKWGDTRCLTRYDPKMVFNLCLELIEKQSFNETVNVLSK